jgi:hypothetical protein
MREQQIAAECIERLDLDLTGLTVLTEAASGPYLFTPLTAALAGAEQVLALTTDSEYGAKEDVAETTAREAARWNVDDRLEVGFVKGAEWLQAADIVTNSGFVRPIDANAVAQLKQTAVIPLMWETWEFRADDLDLGACRKRGIPVLGTCETRPPCDMRPYSGAVALKLLTDELGIRGRGARVVLLGGHPSLGVPIRQRLMAHGLDVTWFATDAGARSYEELGPHLHEHARDYDALLVAEHEDARLLLGPGGLVTPAELAAQNADLRIGVIAGNLDADALRASGLRFAPERIRPFGYESYGASELGPQPVLELYAAGLKVGEAMARARLRGATPVEAARHAIASSPAMDFSGELAWT